MVPHWGLQLVFIPQAGELIATGRVREVRRGALLRERVEKLSAVSPKTPGQGLL